MVHWWFIYWVRDSCSAIVFVKHVKNYRRPSFVIVHNAVRMLELLLCGESSRKCHHAAQEMPKKNSRPPKKKKKIVLQMSQNNDGFRQNNSQGF